MCSEDPEAEAGNSGGLVQSSSSLCCPVRVGSAGPVSSSWCLGSVSFLVTLQEVGGGEAAVS